MSVVAVGALPPSIPKRTLSRFEIAFGIMLPIVCCALDPFLIDVTKIAPLALWGVAGLGIFALALSVFKTSHIANDLMTGMLAGSAIAAGLIGIALLPLTLTTIFLSFMTMTINGAGFVGIALLGFVPFLTAKAFYDRANALHARLQNHRKSLIVLGAMIVLGAPLTAQGAEIYWLDREFAALANQNAQTRLNAARVLIAYPLMRDRIALRACNEKSSREHNSEPKIDELDMLIGPEGNFKCLRLRD